MPNPHFQKRHVLKLTSCLVSARRGTAPGPEFDHLVKSLYHMIALDNPNFWGHRFLCEVYETLDPTEKARQLGVLEHAEKSLQLEREVKKKRPKKDDGARSEQQDHEEQRIAKQDQNQLVRERLAEQKDEEFFA